MNKKEIERVIKDLEFLNREINSAKADKNYKPHYPCNIDENKDEENEEE